MNKKDILITPIITPGFEVFDTIRFQQIKEEDKLYGSDFLSDSTKITMKKYKKYYVYIETPLNSYFCINKFYYLNGNIMRKGLSFNYKNFTKGIWSFYDKEGNLTETIDYDAPFKFTFEQVLEFCKKEGIVFKTGSSLADDSFYKPQIRRYNKSEQGLCYWEIDWFNPKKGKIETIKLDGVTGKVISKEYMDYII